ncbi:MAG: PcfJ domain-containing protein [Ruminococcus sp.]|nr:PcfJ domain-containing protein [Ruminococcus sp.]
MKEEKALEFLDKFPDVPEELFRQARKVHKAFVLFNHENRAYCTYCEREFDIKRGGEFAHKRRCFCPRCKIPAAAIDITNNYSGKKTADIANVTIFLAGRDGNLYARCFSQRMAFKHGNLHPLRDVIETQRYVFTPNGAARFGIGYGWYEDGMRWYKCVSKGQWLVREKFTLPNFFDTGMYYKVYHAYDEINLENAVKKTWMKNCEVGALNPDMSALSYLNFYIRHRGAERLIKCGFAEDVASMVHDSDLAKKVKWKENEVTKMIGVNRAELRYIRENGFRLSLVFTAKRIFPKMTAETAIKYYRAFNYADRAIPEVLKLIGRENTARLAKYLKKQDLYFGVYKDYIENCRELGCDLTSREILFPPHLIDAHDRAAAAMEARRLEERMKAEKANRAKIAKIKRSRKRFEFEHGKYLIRLPENAEEIIAEGKALRHCVGGYAERHLLGKTTILFLRKKSEPDKPYFTIEVGNDLELVQCHGYRNEYENNKPQDIIELEGVYQKYLEELKFGKKQLKKGA